MSEKIITITIDTDGATEISLKGWERESPKIAAIFEEGATVERVDWNPKAHAHNHVHGGHSH